MLKFKFYDEEGEWRATIDNYYHAVGITKDEAVRRLGDFLRIEHPEVFAARKPVLDAYWQPV